jgi:protein-disulfide isomerase
MSKRDEIRARRKREQLRNRLIVIFLVVVGVLLVVFALIVPSLNKANSTAATSTLVQVTPVPRVAAVNGTTMGDPKAPVKLDVWEDFQCSGCLDYTKTLEPQIIQTYIDTGKVFFTFHFYPFIDGGQGESHQAADAAMCANAQGKFWDYHDLLFANWLGENAGSYTEARLAALAQQANLDMTTFNTCYKANTYSSQIAQDVAAGSKVGVPPTPGIFVNMKMVVASAGANYIPNFADISAAIDAGLAGK